MNLGNLQKYLTELRQDIYPQPPDDGHQAMILEVIRRWVTPLALEEQTILDVGCGQGQAIPALQRRSKKTIGVTLGEDLAIARQKGYDVIEADMSFLDMLPDHSIGLIFARHTLEHSPMPLLTLMEWHRISQRWLLVVVPDPDFFGVGGRNHYSVLYPEQWLALFEMAGWQVEQFEHVTRRPCYEFRWLLEKRSRHHVNLRSIKRQQDAA